MMPFKSRKSKQKNPSPDHIPGSTNEEDLRSEFMVTEAERPKRVYKPGASYMTPARALKLTLGLVTLFLTWFLFLGPGRPTLDKFIGSLDDFTISLPQVSPTPTHPTPTPQPTATRSALITLAPTFTPTVEQNPATETPTIAPLSSPEVTPPTEAPTTVPTVEITGCVPAISVKLSDEGKVLCVMGYVKRTEKQTNAFLITLENPKDAFYFISYDRTWEHLQVGTCVFATGEVKHFGSAPVMFLDYQVDLEFCP